MAGTVGAIFNGALQLGSAVGISAVSSIETSIEEKSGNPSGYAGRAAAFWFMLGIIGCEIISLLIFYRVEAERSAPDGDTENIPDLEKGNATDIEKQGSLDTEEDSHRHSVADEVDDSKYQPDKSESREEIVV